MSRPTIAWQPLRRRLLPLPVRAARDGRGLRVQRQRLPGAALAGLHARMVRRHRRRVRQARRAARSRHAGEHRQQPQGRASRRRCSRSPSAPRTPSCSSGRGFAARPLLAMMMLWPLVIPGVILGISILAFFSRLANGLEDWLQRDLDVLRPGLGARRARPALLHPHHLDADHRGAAAALRPRARGGGLRSRRRHLARVPDRDACPTCGRR